MPGSKKIELFARNNNLRKGWLSLGNQLGENYVNWKNTITCDECEKEILTG
jgi:mRNA (2'-O-methyladenosine-N6-)-methyltransferase